LLRFIDTKKKRNLLAALFIYIPIVSVIGGAPIPFPSLYSPTQEQIAVLNFSSLIITVIGSIVAVGFYLEKRQNKKMEDIENNIEESAMATNEHIKEFRTEIKDMVHRMGDSAFSKVSELDKHIIERVVAAKLLEDERISQIYERLRRLENNNNNNKSSSSTNRNSRMGGTYTKDD
jgi:large-conductance mechanosensitive channel